MLDLIESFMEKIPIAGCWIWTGASIGEGYGAFLGTYAHRLSYQLYKGPIPEGLWVLHTCDVRCCVNPDHLYAGTRADNIGDMINRNRFNRGYGPAPYRRKLVSSEENLVLSMLSSGLTQRNVATLLGISQWMVHAIFHGRPTRVRR